MKFKKSKGFFFIMLSIALFSCGGPRTEEVTATEESLVVTEEDSVRDNESMSISEFNNNSSPESVVNALLDAAKTGEVENLTELLPPDNQVNEDCIALCNVGNIKMKKVLSENFIPIDFFKSYFSKAKIAGRISTNGKTAHVKIIYENNAERNTTLVIEKIKEKWYLRNCKIVRK